MDVGPSFRTDGVQISLQWLKKGDMSVDMEDKIPANSVRLINASFTGATCFVRQKSGVQIGGEIVCRVLN